MADADSSTSTSPTADAAARIAALEARIAELVRERDELRSAYDRLWLEVELIRRRIGLPLARLGGRARTRAILSAVAGAISTLLGIRSADLVIAGSGLEVGDPAQGPQTRHEEVLATAVDDELE